jgi:hypothetical protein
MRFIGFKWLIILFVFFGFLIEGNVFADESNNIDISYKMIESNSDDQAIRMVVKLKAKNNTSYPLFDVIARVDSTKNVNIDTNEIYLGDIRPGQVAVSSESLRLLISLNLSEQKAPLVETGWMLEYKDKNYETIIEKIILR